MTVQVAKYLERLLQCTGAVDDEVRTDVQWLYSQVCSSIIIWV